jgi:O-antigen ligase/tetratricopeptide (TPR) repeat protein
MEKKIQAPTNRATFDANHIISGLILIAYGFITVIVPNLKTMDANATKFLFLSLLNILVFIFLFLRKNQQYARWAFGYFFKNPIAIAYSVLLVISLFSFSVATNLNESILTFAKLFAVFSATWMVAMIIYHDKDSFRYLAIAMSALLLFDSITVFNEIYKYINGDIASIALIKSVYSNKNMLASSIFVKIPFALWLLFYEPKWIRITGWIIIMFSVLATLFLSTRAFYLGTIAIFIVIILFLVVRYKHTHIIKNLTMVWFTITAFALGFVIFSTVQRTAYPNPGIGLEQGVISRMQTIKGSDGGGGRLEAWKRSFNLIKENPVLGVGLGNWKVDILKQENLTSRNFYTFYKNHNDFIEIAAETGIFGGLSFLTIFVLTLVNFIRAIRKKVAYDQMKFIFIPAMGLFCYSVDAFFNFPHDRPEIQALFALYTGAAIALSYKDGLIKKDPARKNDLKITSPKWMIYVFTLLFAIGLLVSFQLLYWNFKSMKLQWLVEAELRYKSMKRHSSAKFLTGFPPIPDLTYLGEPIALQKARYLISENRKKEAIDLLKSDHSSPYDIMNDFFIAQAYSDLGDLDSALVYSRKVYDRKPLLLDNIALMSSILEKKDNYHDAVEIWDAYLIHGKDSARAWNLAAVCNERAGNIEKAFKLIDSAKYYYPRDTTILKNYGIIYEKYKIEPYQEIYQDGITEFNRRNYSKAIQFLSDFLEHVPDHASSYEWRAYCYYYMKSYLKSIDDINAYLKYSGTLKANLLNLRGVNYYSLGKYDEACADFEAAMKMNDQEGINNFNRVCKTRLQSE